MMRTTYRSSPKLTSKPNQNDCVDAPASLDLKKTIGMKQVIPEG